MEELNPQSKVSPPETPTTDVTQPNLEPSTSNLDNKLPLPSKPPLQIPNSKFQIPNPSHPHLHPIHGKNYFTCLSLSIVSVVIGIILVMLLAIKAGLLQFPFLTGLYHGPEPTRVVQAEPLSFDAFKNLMTKRMVAQGVKESYVLKISEQELTGALAGGIAQSVRSTSFNVKAAQVVVEPDRLELYFKAVWLATIHLDILINLSPELEGDQLRFDPYEARVGDIPVPSAWALEIAKYVFSTDLGTWQIRVNDSLGITGFRLERGYFTAILDNNR